MAVILGIDIGTTSVKAMLLDSEKGVLAVHAKGYGVSIPQLGWAEQDPEMWWASLKEVLEALRGEQPEAYANVAAVGFSGQMHGLVTVDAAGKPVRPAIIWLDQRSKKQLAEIEEVCPEKKMGEIFRNRVSCGFAFPSLLWIKEEEPENFARIAAVLCPKDYLRLRITGEAGAEAVDASSTGMADTAHRDWAWEVIDAFGFPRAIFPPVHESTELAGVISEACAAETGLPAGAKVIYGGGDQPIQAIGNAAAREGYLISNIGTGGQVSAFVGEPIYDEKLRTNTFCHAVKRGYTIFGATLTAGKSMDWAKNYILKVDSYKELNELAGAVPAGSEGLIYLPYLSGERTPHLNPDATGMFFGMKLGHGRGHFLRAVMEGVTYSLKDCLVLLNELGVDAPQIIASGGGAASEIWLQIQADIFGKDVVACAEKEQACLGACLLAGASAGIFASLDEGCERFVRMQEKVYHPIPEHVKVYEEGFEKFRELYRRTKDLMG